MSLVDLGKRLLEAAKSGLTDEVRALMSNGAPFTTDWLGTSPLHFASQNGHVDTAEVLLRAGISRDARTKVDRTPLHVAAQEGHSDIVELLIRNGADIEAKDMLKMTPLHWAVEKGHITVIELLFQHGASINVDNKFDKNPVDIAITNGRADIAELLQVVRVGANVVEVSTDPSVIEEVTTEAAVATETISTTLGELDPSHGQIIATEAGASEQSSTAVLATLAALAEATGPLNAGNATSTTAAEALNWLETHGITMISNNDSNTIVTSTLESGHTLTLTDAGKLALNYVKDGHEGEEQIIDGTEQIITDEDGNQIITDEDGNQIITDEHGNQKVITIVTDQGQYVEEGQEHMVVLAEPITDDGACDEPSMKKIKLEAANGIDHHEEL